MNLRKVRDHRSQGSDKKASNGGKSKSGRTCQAINDVKDATVVITNPTHFAVAIKYAPEENDVPIILALGKGSMALRIMERAKNSVWLCDHHYLLEFYFTLVLSELLYLNSYIRQWLL